MKEFEYMPIYGATMSAAICNLLCTKGFKNTKQIDSGGFGMVYSAKNEDGRKVAIKMSFCETKRL